MSSPVPSEAPGRPPPAAPNPNSRRSFTLPARIANKPNPSSAVSGSTDGIETLFTYANTKIVSFTATYPSTQVSTPRTSSGAVEADSPGPIPWKSVTERTLAVGVLRIYRVTSSNVSFLNSGNLLHTIFPKSQCWCVDAQSIFVLRIRQDNYYRIELPHASEQDREKVDEFKIVLAQVLQYEKTRCPFRRGFVVELPEIPKAPAQRRPKKAPEKAKKWLFDKTWVPEDGPRPSDPAVEGSDSSNISSHEEDDRSSINTDANEATPESPATNIEVTPPKPIPPPSVRERAKSFQGSRAVTAPSGLSVVSMSTPQVDASVDASIPEERIQSPIEEAEQNQLDETVSLTSSRESFYSLATISPGSPSPQFLDAEAEPFNPWLGEQESREEQEERGRGRHRRQISEVTVRARSVGFDDGSTDSLPSTPTVDHLATSSPIVGIHLSSPPSTPPLMNDSDEDSIELPHMDVPTPPNTLRLKRLTGATQKRAFSPMPHPQNLFCPPTRGGQGKQFTAALVRKTCELILGPPSHLVTLMLRIAAKIANGAFGFDTYHVRHSPERIPCSWESSDEDDWTEDDYGIPLRSVEREGPALRRTTFSGEVD